MKIKFKKYTTRVTTISSPFPDEIGSHVCEDVIACCGNCGRSVEQAYFYKEWNYCPYCGEKIDWPDEERSK